MQNLKLGFKMQHSQLPANVIATCTTDVEKKSLKKVHSYNTRRKGEQNHPKLASKWYQSSFLVKSVGSFQSLPDQIRNIKDYHHFVTSCKRHILN